MICGHWLDIAFEADERICIESFLKCYGDPLYKLIRIFNIEADKYSWNESLSTCRKQTPEFLFCNIKSMYFCMNPWYFCSSFFFLIDSRSSLNWWSVIVSENFFKINFLIDKELFVCHIIIELQRKPLHVSFFITEINTFFKEHSIYFKALIFFLEHLIFSSFCINLLYALLITYIKLIVLFSFLFRNIKFLLSKSFLS